MTNLTLQKSPINPFQFIKKVNPIIHPPTDVKKYPLLTKTIRYKNQIFRHYPYHPAYLVAQTGKRIISLKGENLSFLTVSTKSVSKNYKRVAIHDLNGKQRSPFISSIQATIYLGHLHNGYKIIVDHIDDMPSNNHKDNIQLLSSRDNTLKNKTKTGAYYCNSSNRYIAMIRFNGKQQYLGSFKDKQSAINIYNQTYHSLRTKNAILDNYNKTKSKHQSERTRLYNKAELWLKQNPQIMDYLKIT